MNRTQEEVIQRITAQYVADIQAGRNPKISDYLARYPQHAAEIADFVAYFHAFEEDIPGETETIPELSGEFRIAIESTLASIDQLPTYVDESPKQASVLYQQRVAEEQLIYQPGEQQPPLADE